MALEQEEDREELESCSRQELLDLAAAWGLDVEADASHADLVDLLAHYA